MSFPIFKDGVRFEAFKLNELFDCNRYQVQSYFADVKTAKDVADKVIRQVQYPFYRGQPTDQHRWNHFHGLWCHNIEEDYWQTCSETALFNVGDCEDSSILTVCGMRLLGISPNNVYEVFGVVTDESGNVLGGHGWVYASDPSFGTSNFVLVESTLDIPPAKYPEVGATLGDLKKPFHWGGWVYVPQLFFNDQLYIEIPQSFVHDKYSLQATLKMHPRLRKKFKENRAKYEALAKAWDAEMKPLKSYKKVNRILRILRKW